MNKPIVFVLETGSLAGGVRVVLEMANRLKQRGHGVEIWSVNDKKTASWFDIHPGIKWVSFLKSGRIEDYDAMGPALKNYEAVKVATYWRTAYAMHEMDAVAPGEGFYLVQDRETVYASVPQVRSMVLDTYQYPEFRKITTSRWVEANVPGCEHVGIGINTKLYRRNAKLTRNGLPLAVLRRTWLKGYDQLMEISRILATGGRRLSTFGLDAENSLPCFAPVKHYSKPTDRQIVDLLSSHGVFLSTSVHEGFNLTVLEAMACGLPVSKSKDDGSAEYCDHGVNCLEGDTPEQIAENAVKILKTPALAEDLADAGVETAKRYPWSDVIDRLESKLSPA